MELIKRLVCVGVVLGMASACGETSPLPAPPTPTVLRLDLQTPRFDDGAVVLTLQGPEVSDLQAASAAYLLYSRPATADKMRVIVIGNLKGGPLVTLSIGPGHQLSDYSVTIDQVAARTDTLRTDLSGYQVNVTAP
jgi:hypothetical protein